MIYCRDSEFTVCGRKWGHRAEFWHKHLRDRKPALS